MQEVHSIAGGPLYLCTLLVAYASISISMSISISISIYVYTYMYLYLSIYQYIYTYIYTYIDTYLYVCLRIYTGIHNYICIRTFMHGMSTHGTVRVVFPLQVYAAGSYNLSPEVVSEVPFLNNPTKKKTLEHNLLLFVAKHSLVSPPSVAN